MGPPKPDVPTRRDDERKAPQPTDHVGSSARPARLEAEILPAAKPGRAARRATMARSIFVGPLPPAQELQRYDKVLEGAADRILKMAESEQRHGQQMDRDALAADREIASRGQHYALIATGGLGAAGLVLGLTGHDWLGGVCFISALVPVVAGFLGGPANPTKPEAPDPKRLPPTPPKKGEAHGTGDS
ncbi:MAG: hypothetical protein BGO49_18680 [Planctomycetales bacterium 71-10]|nr:MAG: hypothetical protein BGO49_18680 [Planctomycetales bacterium 71-10]